MSRVICQLFIGKDEIKVWKLSSFDFRFSNWFGNRIKVNQLIKQRSCNILLSFNKRKKSQDIFYLQNIICFLSLLNLFFISCDVQFLNRRCQVLMCSFVISHGYFSMKNLDVSLLGYLIWRVFTVIAKELSWNCSSYYILLSFKPKYWGSAKSKCTFFYFILSYGILEPIFRNKTSAYNFIWTKRNRQNIALDFFLHCWKCAILADIKTLKTFFGCLDAIASCTLIDFKMETYILQKFCLQYPFVKVDGWNATKVLMQFWYNI